MRYWRSEDDYSEESSAEVFEPFEPSYQASDFYGAIDAKICLDQLMRKLSREERILTHLKLDGYMDSEIAEMYGVTQRTISARQSKILNKLRKYA